MDSRDLAGEGAEGLWEGEHLGQHGSTHAQHRHGAEREGGRDNADDGAHENGQQMPNRAG